MARTFYSCIWRAGDFRLDLDPDLDVDACLVTGVGRAGDRRLDLFLESDLGFSFYIADRVGLEGDFYLDPFFDLEFDLD